MKGLSITYDPKTQSVTLTTQGTVYVSKGVKELCNCDYTGS